LELFWKIKRGVGREGLNCCLFFSVFWEPFAILFDQNFESNCSLAITQNFDFCLYIWSGPCFTSLQRRDISISIIIQCFQILQRIYATFVFVYELFNFWNMFNLTVLIYFGQNCSLNASLRSKLWESHFLFQCAQCAQSLSSPLNSKICRWYKSYHIFKFSSSFFLKTTTTVYCLLSLFGSIFTNPGLWKGSRIIVRF